MGKSGFCKWFKRDAARHITREIVSLRRSRSGWAAAGIRLTNYKNEFPGPIHGDMRAQAKQLSADPFEPELRAALYSSSVAMGFTR